MAKILVLFGFVLTVSSVAPTDIEKCTVELCDCQYFVHCESRNLTELPPIVNTTKLFPGIYFSRNFITRVEDGSFLNLSRVNNNLLIDLSYNQINYIGPRAFQGLETVKLELHLEHNDIVALPTALMDLNHLDNLIISGIYNYDTTIMKHIGKTLTSFSVGDLTRWPQDLTILLRNVKQLTLFELTMPKLSAENVTNLAPEFSVLNIEDSFLQESLDDFCDIQKRYSLQLRNLRSPLGVELVPHCQPPTAFIEELLVDHLYVINISRTLENMPGLSRVSLSLPGMKSLTLPGNNNITSLAVTATPLVKFPFSVGMSTRLDSIYITDSQISAIGREDLLYFPGLRQLHIWNSPLASIDEHAFENTRDIVMLEINHSKLTVFPKAITRLPSLADLTLTNSSIPCTCDMVWLLEWQGLNSVYINGDCLGNESSLSMYMQHLNHCISSPVIG